MNIHANNYESFLDTWFQLKRKHKKYLEGINEYPRRCCVAGRWYILCDQQDLDDMIDDLGKALDKYKQAHFIPSGQPYRTP